MNDKIESFAEEHPTGCTLALSGIGLVIGTAIAIGGYCVMGKIAGKSAARELVKSGVLKA